ncbi:hypothetical protein RJ639_021256 [Escallonia herrerae]|uniref:(+)-neomenthol dehydrogenase-like n=1 Tax=Escallonia herrerae TaxID=1293975 RepID=A0AA88V3R4_9ASTE|nr:hypothetical protein RJ639_021256 [Escallonia herrerae]
MREKKGRRKIQKLKYNFPLEEDRLLYAVVTEANKGIGLETVRRLAAAGLTVVLTARDEKGGVVATRALQASGLSNLDVQDPKSVESLAKFIHDQFGRLDVLVNNAGASGVMVDEDGLRALNIDPASWLNIDKITSATTQLSGRAMDMVQGVIKSTYETAKECLNTNYYGVKRVTKALIPLLQLSHSGARIVNVSSLRGELRRIPSEKTREELGDIDTQQRRKSMESWKDFCTI